MDLKVFSIKNISTGRNLLIFFILLKLVITLIPINYGIGGDEVYYIAMSDRLDIGYVDVPPIAPFFLAVIRFFLGTTFLSIHLIPAIIGASVAVIAYFMVKQMGGNIWAQFITLTCVTMAPQYIGRKL